MSVIFSECYVHVHTFDSDHAQHIEYVRYIYIFILLILIIAAGYIIGIAHHNQISHIFILKYYINIIHIYFHIEVIQIQLAFLRLRLYRLETAPSGKCIISHMYYTLRLTV